MSYTIKLTQYIYIYICSYYGHILTTYQQKWNRHDESAIGKYIHHHENDESIIKMVQNVAHLNAIENEKCGSKLCVQQGKLIFIMLEHVQNVNRYVSFIVWICK